MGLEELTTRVDKLEDFVKGMGSKGLARAKVGDDGKLTATGNTDAIVLMVGYQTEAQLRFVYSYDITISKLTMKSAGAHELSLIYEWPRKAKARRHKVVPCPKF